MNARNYYQAYCKIYILQYLFIVYYLTLCPHRLVEVNGAPVVSATLEELKDLLRLGPCVQIVVLRQPPPTLVSTCLKQPAISPDHVQTLWPQRDEVTTETAPQRKMMAI